MRGFEIIGTTADVGIVARGRTLAELFENAAVGMFAIIFGGASCQVDASDQKRIHLFSSDAEALLVAWLSELLWYFDAELMVARSFRLRVESKAGQTEPAGERAGAQPAILDAAVGFVPLSEAGIRPVVEIKAVTMHNLKITRRGENISARIIFDI